MALTRTGFILLIVVIVLLVIYVFPIHIHTRQLIPPVAPPSHATSLHANRASLYTTSHDAPVAAHFAPGHSHSTDISLFSELARSTSDVLPRLSAAGVSTTDVRTACAGLHAAHALQLAADRAARLTNEGVLTAALRAEASRVTGSAHAVLRQMDARAACAHRVAHDAAYAAFHLRVAQLLHPAYALVAAVPRALRARDPAVAVALDAFVVHNPLVVDRAVARSVFRQAVELEIESVIAV